MAYVEANGRHLVADIIAKLAAQPTKDTYDFPTLGARTKQGGEVATASTGTDISGYRIASVGDMVRYPQ